MAKRAGRAHDPSGLEGTPPGGMSVPCRACPHPDINLPSDWANEPAETQLLLFLFFIGSYHSLEFYSGGYTARSLRKMLTLSRRHVHDQTSTRILLLDRVGVHL
jgi:hypothetical protein